MKELICIVCPKGCHLKVDEQNGYTVTGYSCPRGAEYGKNECQNPTRVLTSTVKIDGAAYRRCPVKTSMPIPKERMREAMKLLDHVQLQAPVTVGQVVIPNLFNSGADIVVTKDM